MENSKKLVRSNNKVIAGILGGIAEYLGVSATATRWVYSLLTVLTVFSGVLLYFLLWLMIPKAAND